MNDIEIPSCSYCQSEDTEMHVYPLQLHEQRSREYDGLIPIEEPILLCRLCWSAAHRVQSLLIYNHPSDESMVERVIARYLNAYAQTREKQQ